MYIYIYIYICIYIYIYNISKPLNLVVEITVPNSTLHSENLPELSPDCSY